MGKIWTRIYWLFWLLPLALLPCIWISAMASDIGVLTTVEGTGILVLKNYFDLVLFYIFCTCSLFLAEISRGLLGIKVLIFGMLVCFCTLMLFLPRMIIGPIGLSQSGMRDVDFYYGLYRVSISWQYCVVVGSLLLASLTYYLFQIVGLKPKE